MKGERSNDYKASSGRARWLAALLPIEKDGGSVGPPRMVIVVQVAAALELIQLVHWLVPPLGHWDLIVWIGVGAPMAAAIHRFNKAHTALPPARPCGTALSGEGPQVEGLPERLGHNGGRRGGGLAADPVHVGCDGRVAAGRSLLVPA